MTFGAVIPAAGSASRLGEKDKILLNIGGRSVIQRVVEALAESNQISELVIVASSRNHDLVKKHVHEIECAKPWKVVIGGPTRRESVQNGVSALGERCSFVLIHDAARPLVSSQTIRLVIDAAMTFGAAVAGVPVADTIKQVQNDKVARSLERQSLIAVQTPQAMRLDWLQEAHSRFDGSFDATDEAMLLEASGFPVQVVAGDPMNLKITTLFDLLVVEAILANRGTHDL